MAMTRRRYVLPETFSKEELLELSPSVRLLEMGLRLYADDHGRERVNPLLIRAAMFPLDEGVTTKTIENWLLDLDDAGCIALYSAAGKDYFAFVDWPTVDRPQASRFPAPPSPEPLANESRSPRDPFVAGEREREGEWASEGESERGHARSDRDEARPSPFCRAHPDGTDHPCRSCGTARLRHRRWQDEQLEAAGVRFVDRDPE